MAEKLLTKSFERLLDKGKHRGFITYEELGKSGKLTGESAVAFAAKTFEESVGAYKLSLSS